MERDVMVEEEIDLRQYVLVLVKRKWLIIGLTALAAVAAFAWSVSQPKLYKATARVVISEIQLEIRFAPEHGSVVTPTVIGPQKSKDRSKTLLALVKNGAIAQAVSDKLSKLLSDREKSPAVLIGMVEGKSEGDVIHISAANRDPEKAALIASTWAEEYERYVNTVCSSAIGQELIDSVGVEVKRSKQEYDTAEKALTEFLGSSKLDATERMVQEKKNVVHNLEQIKRKRLDIAVGEIADCYAEKRRLRGLLGNAKALAQQIEVDGGASTGTALALVLLEEKIYARESKAEIEKRDRKPEVEVEHQPRAQVERAVQGNIWQLDLSSIVDSGQVKQRKEIAALVQVLRKRLAELDTVISEAFTGPPPPEAGVVARSARETWLERALSREGMEDIESAMKKMEGEILRLEGKIAEQKAREKELTMARDQAWEIYPVLAKKAEKLRVIGQIKGREVKMTSVAIVPQNPVSPKTGRNVGLAAVVGFMVSCFLAFFVEFVGTIPKP